MITELVGRKTRISGPVVTALDKNLNKKVTRIFYVMMPPRTWTAQIIVAYSVKVLSCEADGRDECV